jgi:hypothetical protein
MLMVEHGRPAPAAFTFLGSFKQKLDNRPDVRLDVYRRN